MMKNYHARTLSRLSRFLIRDSERIPRSLLQGNLQFDEPHFADSSCRLKCLGGQMVILEENTRIRRQDFSIIFKKG
jgi:hypothetical protein